MCVVGQPRKPGFSQENVRKFEIVNNVNNPLFFDIQRYAAMFRSNLFTSKCSFMALFL